MFARDLVAVARTVNGVRNSSSPMAFFHERLLSLALYTALASPINKRLQSASRLGLCQVSLCLLRKFCGISKHPIEKSLAEPESSVVELEDDTVSVGDSVKKVQLQKGILGTRRTIFVGEVLLVRNRAVKANRRTVSAIVMRQFLLFSFFQLQ